MEESGGETTGGTVRCVAAEQRQWQALIEGYLSRVRADATPTATAALEAYLAAHNEWRTTRCRYAATMYEGGSLARVVASACARDSTANLAIDLYERLNMN